MNSTLAHAAKTTYPMVWWFGSPVEGKVRRGHPCKIVQRVTPGGHVTHEARSVREGSIERVTVQFTDGIMATAPRRAIRTRKWAMEDNTNTETTTMNSTESTVEDFAAWKASGELMLTSMREERETLAARLAELDASIAAFPSFGSTAKPRKAKAPKATNGNGKEKPGKGMSAYIMAFVSASESAVSSADILDAVKIEMPDVDPRSVYSALSVMANKSKKLVATGARGSMTYREAGAS